MINIRLIDYINSQVSKGVSLEQIRQRLISKGWQDYQIKPAMDSALMQQITGTPSNQTDYHKPVKKSLNPLVILFLGIALIAGGVLMLIILIISYFLHQP